jgi:hypothetical protein
MRRTRNEVASEIEAFLGGQGGAWDWDDFISIRLDDRGLEAVRSLCGSLPELFPPDRKGQYCSARGLELLRTLVRLLREEPV